MENLAILIEPRTEILSRLKGLSEVKRKELITQLIDTLGVAKGINHYAATGINSGPIPALWRGVMDARAAMIREGQELTYYVGVEAYDQHCWILEGCPEKDNLTHRQRIILNQYLVKAGYEEREMTATEWKEKHGSTAYKQYYTLIPGKNKSDYRPATLDELQNIIKTLDDKPIAKDLVSAEIKRIENR